MTIVIGSTRAATLAAADESNNAFVTPAPISGGTATTATGTQVEAASNALTGTTFDPWVATPSANTARLQVVYGSNQTPTIGAIAAHNLSDVGASVRLQYSTDSGSSWSDCGAGIVTPSDNQAIAWRFEGVTADYWRLEITSASDDVSIGVLVIGSEIIIPRRIYQGFAPALTPSEVELTANVSEGAHLLGSAAVVRGSTLAAEFSNIAPAFIRGADWLAFQTRFNAGNGCFFGWRPAKYNDLHYIWRTAPIRPTNTGPADLMGFSLQARAYDE